MAVGQELGKGGKRIGNMFVNCAAKGLKVEERVVDEESPAPCLPSQIESFDVSYREILYTYHVRIEYIWSGNFSCLRNGVEGPSIEIDPKLYFLELAMSLLDFSSRIPLGTFSILLINTLDVTHK